MQPPHPNPPPEAEEADLRQQLHLLEAHVARNDAEIDTLQIQAARAARPWYRDASILIALMALLFSFGTTGVSYYMTAQQAIQNNRAELRTFLQRLSALPRENAELAAYPDRLIAAQLSSMINAEATLLASQAVEVMNRLPASYVSANEYNLVAGILFSTGEFELAGQLLERALTITKSPNEERATLRAYGNLLFASGNAEKGREMYRKALEVSRLYPSQVRYYTDWSDAYTEMLWAGAELSQKHCGEAREHIQQAFQLAQQLTPGAGRDELMGQLQQANLLVEACTP
ncbi:hypothetical protein FKZ61_017720 [Litorilinea aerophila]|uniref:Uncharacterized protein n=1 Tax=Litorilinea aerophila TaxID=1204385 RepID=A0A540VBQ2_9CHLR|nr:tetratricopeptide repeat protein [Litorilinea aerophila]MCC9077938.1 hypothetical protein [Litorilinea aerophila]